MPLTLPGSTHHEASRVFKSQNHALLNPLCSPDQVRNVTFSPRFLNAPPNHRPHPPRSPADPSCKPSSIDGIHAQVSACVPSLDHVRKSLPVISESLALYPPDFLRAIGLKGVVLCRGLSFRGQRRGHVPVLGQGYLLAEVDPGTYSLQRRYTSLHHELWHMADYAQFGRSYDKSDPEFTERNPAGFAYDARGGHYHRQHIRNHPSQLPEFLNTYSTASVAEDKAEVWAHLIWHPEVIAANATLQHKARMRCHQRL